MARAPEPAAAGSAPSTEGAGGYQTEEMLPLQDPTIYATLVPLSKEEAKKLAKERGTLILCEWRQLQAKLLRPIDGSHVVVGRQEFTDQFSQFTSGLFEDWDPALWENVLVAGGAVLGSLLPLPEGFETLQSWAGVEGVREIMPMFDFKMQHLYTSNRSPRSSSATFLGWKRWQGADIDLFIYGLDKQAAARKLEAILKALRRAVVKAAGVKYEALFIKTPNTVTMRCAPLYRDVQVFARAVSRSPIATASSFSRSLRHRWPHARARRSLSSGHQFCIFCHALRPRKSSGDHAPVRGQGRHPQLLRHRLLRVRLRRRAGVRDAWRNQGGVHQVCGDRPFDPWRAYETRLLKYAQRGFCIGVPLLQRSKLSRDALHFELAESEYDYSEELTPTLESLQKWTSTHYLDRLLIVESWANQAGGMLEGNPFPGRVRRLNETTTDHCPRAILYLNGVGDAYPGRFSDQRSAYPATTDLSRILTNPNYTWRVNWQVGNMPRKPVSWEEWSRSSLEDMCGRFDYKE
jgi:hypothetical protein